MKIKVIDIDGKEIEIEIAEESKEAECLRNIIFRQNNNKEVETNERKD